MGGVDPLIAVVGKPSAGKSSFLNAITDAKAKTGNFPFTTIKPNHGVCYIPIDCPCARFDKSSLCAPVYGRCVNGSRFIPIRILDVAGLVPGAHRGEGLGNQFLDDLRTANALIHIVDVSGTTDASGKETIGYDPINDIDWLTSEIHEWIYGNLKKKWGGIVRRHIALSMLHCFSSKEATIAETLQTQFSGYGSNINIVHRFLDKMGMKTPMDQWEDSDIHNVVSAFLDERFPTIIGLNKIDLSESDKNIDKIWRKYDASKLIPISALSEVFLKKLHQQRFINYEEGTDFIELAQDKEDDPNSDLKEMDEKTRLRLEKVQDLVLFRFGTTGVLECVKKAFLALDLIPVFPVRNITNFTSSSGGRTSGVFRDCYLVRNGTTVREFSQMLNGDLDKHYQYAETVGGVRLGEGDVISSQNNIISFKLIHE